MLEEIIGLAKILNKEDSLPSSGLKRNSVYYPLVTYINHTIALLISMRNNIYFWKIEMR